MNLLQKIEHDQVAKLTETSTPPQFSAGDTLKVSVKVVEGTRERLQAYEGVCIARKNAGINSSFTVRKISYGEGVERVFPLYSPRVASIEVVRRGDRPPRQAVLPARPEGQESPHYGAHDGSRPGRTGHRGMTEEQDHEDVQTKPVPEETRPAPREPYSREIRNAFA